MKKGLFWLVLTALCAVLAIAQLPMPASRFGGVFFGVLALGCAVEWQLVRRSEQRKVFAVLAVLGRVLFGLFVLAFAAIQLFVIGAGMHADAQAEEADYVLVLGALVNPDGQPSAALAARCDTAAAFLETHPNAKAILCGGQGGNEPRSEADAMHEYMVAQGIDESRLIREDQSTNTIENIENARALMEMQAKLSSQYPPPGMAAAVVTNDYHVARARRLMAQAGLDPLGIPARTPYPFQWISVRCREFCSIIGLMVSGRW